MSKNITSWPILFLAVTAILNLMSCSDDADNLKYMPESFSYKVGGVTYRGGFNVGRYSTATPELKMEFYQKYIYENYLYIQIEGANYLAPRQYRVGYDSSARRNIQLMYFSNGSHPYSATSGHLTITKFDTIVQEISGTFSFTGNYAGDTREVNEGRFDNVKYIKQ